MAISKLAVHTRLRPFLLANVDPKVIDNLIDTDFVLLYNDVAKDLNQGAELRIERFYKTTVAANAAYVSDLTSYKTARKILRILSFKYEDDDWVDQIWTYLYEDADGDGRIVLKTTPSGSIQMTVLYLGDIEEVEDDTDEIDLPDNVLPEFVELCKYKLLSDYSEKSNIDYERMVQVFSDKARMKQDRAVTNTGIKPYWLGMTNDEAYKYQILRQWVSAGDNITADLAGNYTWYT